MNTNVSVSPSNEELYAKIHALSENPRRIADVPVKVDVPPTISLESPSMPIKVIVSPSKKFQPPSIPAVQQQFKNPQLFVSQQQQQAQMVINFYSYYICIY